MANSISPLNELEVFALHLDRLVLIGEHGDQIIALSNEAIAVDVVEDAGADDIGMVDLGHGVAGTTMELKLILSGIEIGDLGIIGHATGAVKAAVFVAQDKEVAATAASDYRT